MRIIAAVSILLLGCAASPSATPSSSPPARAAPSREQAARPRMPAVGEAAPSFELVGLDDRSVALGEACARGPVVLVFGSFT